MFLVRPVWLIGLSSLLWALPAYVLIRHATAWMAHLSGASIFIAVVGGLAAVGVIYTFWFKRIVSGNIARIRLLPSPAGLWQVSSVRGYLVVLFMISAGIALRSSDIPRLWLAGPYALMGGCLMLGSLETMVTFLREHRLPENS